MSETIDSLLVSLGLETDAKSFQTANDAVKGIKDGILQLAAAAGTGVGLKALTADLSSSVLEMDRLSKITNFTVKQIDGLRYPYKISRRWTGEACGDCLVKQRENNDLTKCRKWVKNQHSHP
ncbi:lysozyme [Yersinia frederiksenii]|nr:lysozyme [Yersinia frederiksenii]